MKTIPKLAAVLLLCPLQMASAATRAEDDMNKALMPHATLGGSGATVLVHHARLQGTPGANAQWKAQAQALRGQVQQCVAALSKSGMPVHPPTVWPEYSVSVREDSYGANNRSITYTHALGYKVDTRDCSLLESKSSHALLVSDAGACNIDLIEKTASGQCDAKAHANAAPLRAMKPTAAQKAQGDLAMSGGMGPEMAAMLKQLQGTQGGSTGVRKSVAGLSCEVFSGLGEATVCVATGGSFSLLPSTNMNALRYLALESTNQGFSLTAVDAHLDARVSAAVFLPHLAGGFAINKEAP